MLVLGLVLLQVLIGGRRQLFAFPGYFLFGAAALLCVAKVSRARVRPDFLCLGATALFFGYILIRALFSPDYFARPDLFSVAGALVVYGLSVTVFSSSSARLTIFSSLLVFGLVHVLIGVIQFTRGDNFMLISFLQRVDYEQRASGFFVCPNHLAGLLEVLGIFGVSLVCWSRWPLWSKLLVGYATGVCYLGLALTGSRGGYLSAGASLLVFGFLSLIVIRSALPGRWLKFGVIGLIVLVSLLASGGLMINQNGFLRARAGNIVEPNNPRIDLWRAALQQWQLEPVFGTGSGTYRFYGRQFRTERMQNDPVDVHNDYLHLLCEYGLVGAVGFLLFFSAHVRQGWRNLRRLALRTAGSLGGPQSNRLALNIAALAALCAYVVHSVVDFNLHIPANAALLAFVFAIIANPGRSTKSSDPRPALKFIPGVAVPVLGLVLLVQCVRFFPGEYYAEEARTALRDEKPDASILSATKALFYERQNPEIFFHLGRALMARAHQSDQAADRQGFFQGAAEAFQEAHRLAPLDGTYPLNLAFVYDEMGRFADAERVYAVARERDPRSRAVSQLYQAHLESWITTNAPPNQPL